jgi:hypothetical protein
VVEMAAAIWIKMEETRWSNLTEFMCLSEMLSIN